MSLSEQQMKLIDYDDKEENTDDDDDGDEKEVSSP